MKRIICLILVFCMMLAMCVTSHAEDDIVIRVEAEKYSSATVKGGIYEDSGLSEGKAVGFNWAAPKDEDYVYEYLIDVPKTGVYAITAGGTERGLSNTTDWSVYVNTPDNAPSSYVKDGNISTAKLLPSVFKTYSLGEMKLKKGINKLYISINKNDVQQDGVLISMVDYVQLKMNPKAAFKVQTVRFKDNFLGVYENGTNVELKFEFNTIADKEKKFSFEIVDLWDRNVVDGVFSVRKGVDEAVLNLGKFQNGWYRIYLKDENNTEVTKYLAFSVVHPLSDRTVFEDTSWASDIAIEYSGQASAHVDDYARALKLAGLNYARTRGSADLSDSYPVKEALHQHGINETVMHDVSASMHGVSANVPQSYMMIDDLSKIAYTRWKNIANVTADYVEAIEVLNEGDIGFDGIAGTGDLQASYFKAAMIGISDAKVNPIKSYAGFASWTNFTLTNTLENDILSYSDIYNYHQHGEVEQRTAFAKQYSIAYQKPGEKLLPLWATENGFSQNVDDKSVVKNLKGGVRHSIISAVTAMKTGTTKNFYFLTRPYIENNNNFSCWHVDHLPFPMYSAISTYTYELGQGTYKGILDNIPEGVETYLFDNGEGDDVICVWSDHQNYITIDVTELKYVDMVGYEQVMKDTDGDGKIKVSVSEDPIILHLNGRYSEDKYYKQEYGIEKIEQKVYQPYERIVLQQLWDEERYKNPTELKSAREEGYLMEKGESETVRLNIYNFNDQRMSGTIKTVTNGPIVLDKDSSEFSIEPWGQAQIAFTFTVPEDATEGALYNLKFFGVTSEGNDISHTSARYKIKVQDRVIDEKDMIFMTDAVRAEKWDPANRAAGSTVKIVNNQEDKVTFQVQYNGDNWAFPFYYLSEEDKKVMITSSGIVFDRECTEDVGYKTSVFLYTADGRNYYSGTDSAVSYTIDKKQLIFPWSDFDLYHSPLGAFENRPFRLEDITHISIGNSGGRLSGPMPEVTLSKVAFFNSDNPSDKIQEEKSAEVTGIEDGKHYPKDTQFSINAKIPEKEVIEGMRLVINDTEYFDFEQGDTSVTAKIGTLERGKYNLYFSFRNNVGSVFVRTITFYVD